MVPLSQSRTVLYVYFNQVYAKANGYVENWSKIDPAGTYILGRANGNGIVIPQWDGG